MAFLAFLDKTQQFLARFHAAARFAALLRNQCNCVIGYRHGATPDPARNGEFWLVHLLAPSSASFVDVGANVGHWTREFLRAMPVDGRGMLFEPSSIAMEYLRAALRHERRIELLPMALGDVAGQLEFAQEPEAGETSSLVPGASTAAAMRRPVTVTTLDAEVRSRGWETVDFVKIDAEGYDFHVLRGAAQLLKESRIGVVQFEYGAAWALAGSTLTHAVNFLGTMGYQVFLLKKGGLFRLNLKRFGEYFRYSNYVAVSQKAMASLRQHIRGGP